MADRIILEGVKVYAYHGCMDEESRIGSDYEVQMTIWADLSLSAKTDALKDTIDYVFLNKVIEEEMAVRAKLLEVVADRINRRVLAEDQRIRKVRVKVSKLGPPINGDVERVSVEMTLKKKK